MGTLQYLHISYCLVSFDPPPKNFLMQTYVVVFYLITIIILNAPDLCGVQKHWLHFRVEKFPKRFHRLLSNLYKTLKIPKTALLPLAAKSLQAVLNRNFVVKYKPEYLYALTTSVRLFPQNHFPCAAFGTQ